MLTKTLFARNKLCSLVLVKIKLNFLLAVLQYINQKLLCLKLNIQKWLFFNKCDIVTAFKLTTRYSYHFVGKFNFIKNKQVRFNYL